MEGFDEQTNWSQSTACNQGNSVRRTASAWGNVISIMVSQARPGMSTPETTVYLLAPDSPARIACANPACHNGGLDPIPLVRELTQGNHGELRVESCAGRAGRQSAARKGARCDTMFCIRLTDNSGHPELPEVESSASRNGARHY